mmetsp:Transcript_31530/g.72539  ORF Transcript_31530/g.72539 Transcript_31530/m.72539 type:complete len:208 (+) Transcript_31530:744-1367(+)
MGQDLQIGQGRGDRMGQVVFVQCQQSESIIRRHDRGQGSLQSIAMKIQDFQLVVGNKVGWKASRKGIATQIQFHDIGSRQIIIVQGSRQLIMSQIQTAQYRQGTKHVRTSRHTVVIQGHFLQGHHVPHLGGNLARESIVAQGQKPEGREFSQPRRKHSPKEIGFHAQKLQFLQGSNALGKVSREQVGKQREMRQRGQETNLCGHLAL